MISNPDRVAVIGAGIVGASVAFRLATAGLAVTVYETEWPGSGLTRRGGGMMRTHFGHPLNVALAHRSLQRWAAIRDRLGHQLDWHEVGYAVFAESSDDADAIERSVTLQREFGVEVEAFDGAELARRFPAIRPDGIAAVALAPRGGYGNPALCADVLLRAAGALGTVTRIGVTVEEIAAGARVRTTDEPGWQAFDAVVVCAALASTRLAAQVGLDLPFVPLRVQSFLAPLDLGPLPCLLDVGPSGLCVRPDAGGLLAGCLEKPGDVSDFRRLDWPTQTPVVADAVRRRFHVDGDIPFSRGWAGSFDETPDGFPYLGEAPRGSRVFWAAGMCGHGFMHAPAVADEVLTLVTDARSELELDPTRPDRMLAATGAAHGL